MPKSLLENMWLNEMEDLSCEDIPNGGQGWLVAKVVCRICGQWHISCYPVAIDEEDNQECPYCDNDTCEPVEWYGPEDVNMGNECEKCGARIEATDEGNLIYQMHDLCIECYETTRDKCPAIQSYNNCWRLRGKYIVCPYCGERTLPQELKGTPHDMFCDDEARLNIGQSSWGYTDVWNDPDVMCAKCFKPFAVTSWRVFQTYKIGDE